MPECTNMCTLAMTNVPFGAPICAPRTSKVNVVLYMTLCFLLFMIHPCGRGECVCFKWKCRRETPFGRCGCRWEDGIKMDLKEIE
jgi:hypothetical protein